MNLARKLALTVVATVMGSTILAGTTAAPAHAFGDSSWGCGGMCFRGPVAVSDIDR